MSNEPVWRMKHVASANSHLPASPGLYAIGHEETLLGLELQRTYVYIGKTQNMRRRLSEHTHLSELHPDLAGYLRRNRGLVRIWYTTDIDPKDIDGFERRLIRDLNPEFNRIRYEEGGKNG